MSRTLPEYEVFAIRYATREATRAEHFVGGDPHDVPMPMDYFTWVIRQGARVIAVDTGFNKESGTRRGRNFLRCPVEAMTRIGVQPEQVEDVILTHLHYDHVGNFHKFPRARFHLQEREMAYSTGRFMRYPIFAGAYDCDDVAGVVKLNFGGRVEFYNGDVDFAPGLTLHHIGGHTAGLQVVRVHTRRGWMVLASDASHFYENMQKTRPFPIVLSLGDMVDGYRTIEKLAASPDHIIPGHDPLVMKKYPAVEASLAGIMVRLDVPPQPV